MPALYFSRGRQTKALGCAFMCFQFRHNCSLKRFSIFDLRLPISVFGFDTRTMARLSLLAPASLALRGRLLAPAFCLLLTAFWFLVPSRSKDCEQLIAFHARRDFNFAYIFQVMLELRQDAGAELAVRHLAAAKPD